MEVVDNYEFDINPKKVCRLCLSQSIPLVNIYSNSIVDGYIISVPDMLAFTVDIAIGNNDKLPNKICAECKKQIITFYTFKQKTKRTEQSLMSMFGVEPPQPADEIACMQCNEGFESEAEFIEHVQSKHADVYDFENVSAKASQKPAQMEMIVFENENSDSDAINTDDVNVTEDDLLVIEEDDVESYARQSAKRMRSSPSSILQTQNDSQAKSKVPVTSNRTLRSKASTSKSVTITKSEPSDIDESTEYTLTDEHFDEVYAEPIDEPVAQQCEACNEIFSDEADLLQHECDALENTDEAGDLICYPCNKKMKSAAQLHQHNKMHDSMSLIISYIEFFPCHDCCQIFMTKDNLYKHNEMQHPEKLSKDSDDPDSSTSLKKIDESCTDYQFLDDIEKPEEYKDEQYSCGNCGILYPTVNELKKHVILHATKYPCPMYDCGCQYDQLSRLSIHVLNKHINTKNLQCLHCGLSFQTYDDLQHHLKNNCKEKKFKCYECDKKFFSKKALITHLRTLKVKRFKCEYCEKTFKQQGELTIHTRSHTNERPFQCTICNKSYKTSSMRAAHMDSHINGKTFECTLCDKKLQSRTSYRNHMKRHTEEKKHECEHCGKKFFTRYHLKLHQSKMHKIMLDSGADVEDVMDEHITMLVYE